MRPIPTLTRTDEMFRRRLDERLKMSHSLVRLSQLMIWL